MINFGHEYKIMTQDKACVAKALSISIVWRARVGAHTFIL